MRGLGLAVGLVAFGVLAGGCAAERDGTASDGLRTTEQAQTVCAAGPTTKGIDVSHWQGTIDWQKVKGDGIQFAIAKATEGTSFVDPEFAANWAGMKQTGVLRGAYHFFRASSDGVAQAQHFVQVMGPLADGDLPPVLDLEVMDGQPSATVIQRSKDFMAEVEKLTGRTPMLYSGGFFKSLGNPSGFSQYYLWDAHWGVSCPNIPDAGWSTWTFWQYTDKSSVAGIGNGSTSAVDGDEFNGSLQDLIKFASPGVGGTGGTGGAGGAGGTAGASGAGGSGGSLDAGVGGTGGAAAGGSAGAAYDAGLGGSGGATADAGPGAAAPPLPAWFDSSCSLPGPGPVRDGSGWLVFATLGVVAITRRRGARRADGPSRG